MLGDYLTPAIYMKEGRPRSAAPTVHCTPNVELEDVPQTKDDATVATVGAPLIEEVR